MAWTVGGESEYFSRDSEKCLGNVDEMYTFFSQRGWKKNAIAGFLGNVFRESTCNPGLIEIGGSGHGLVQWTPPKNLYDVLDVLYGGHTDWFLGWKQCEVIYAEYQESVGEENRGIEPQWYPTSTWAVTWNMWAHDESRSPEDCASIFMACYERPGVLAESERRENARYFYDYLEGKPPAPGGDVGGLQYLYKKGSMLIGNNGVIFYKNSPNVWIANKSSGNGGSGNAGNAVSLMKELLANPRINYSQSLRWYNLTPYTDGKYYGDCSSLVIEIYQKTNGITIGTYTGDMNPSFSTVVDSGKKRPDLNNLKPGDLMFFGDSSIGEIGSVPTNMPSDARGHVEMYLGNGRCGGHGSGIGPTEKDALTYGENREASGYSGYAGSVRYV